jgi:hypothetical protein
MDYIKLVTITKIAFLGGSKDEGVSSVIQVVNDSFVIAGSTRPTVTADTDMWLLKAQVTETTATKSPRFEFALVFLGLSLVLLITRKRRP